MRPQEWLFGGNLPLSMVERAALTSGRFYQVVVVVLVQLPQGSVSTSQSSLRLPSMMTVRQVQQVLVPPSHIP